MCVYIFNYIYTYVSTPSIYYVDYVDSWFNLCLKIRPRFEENNWFSASRKPHLPLLFVTWTNSNHYSNMGLFENVVYPEKPNGFADHYPY